MKKIFRNMVDTNLPTVRLSLGAVITQHQYDIWKIYVDVFRKRWDFDQQLCEFAGIAGGDLFAAEFTERGDKTYFDSIVLPVRNAFYQMFMANIRWANLREMGLAGPILDYGCGVGYLLHWLRSVGYENLYGYEPPGIQREIMHSAFKDSGITVWDEHAPDRFGTIVCLNVLEHVSDPVGLLNKFYKMTNRVIADVVIDPEDGEQSSHIAPKDALRECAYMLGNRRGLYVERQLEEQTYGT